MTRILRAKYKASRKLKCSIWDSHKDPYTKRNYGPGEHGAAKNPKSSDYGVHLRAKQRLRAHYGRINERQFRNLFDTAHKMKGNSGINFIALLESRLDAIVYRLNLAPTIFAARQIVSHKHIRVNGKKANIASMRLKAGDVVELSEDSAHFSRIKEEIAKIKRAVPDYLSLDTDSLKGTLVKKPDDIALVPYPFDPDVNLIIELYAR
jgi:small subunit ribosomal protein S4